MLHIIQSPQWKRKTFLFCILTFGFSFESSLMSFLFQAFTYDRHWTLINLNGSQFFQTKMIQMVQTDTIAERKEIQKKSERNWKLKRNVLSH